MATEQLFRRSKDGYMEAILPEAQGKAAALSAYLARGGTPFKMSGRYKKGPNKGRNVDEATAEFERMWASAPDSIKQKYADRTSGRMTDMAPSERQKYGIGTPAPKSAAEQQKARMAFYGYEFDENGNAVPINRKKTAAPRISAKDATPGGNVVAGPPAPAKPPGDLSAQAMGTPAQQAEVRRMMGQNSDLATASVGNYMDMQAAVAAGNRGGWAQTSDPDLQPVIDEANAMNANASAKGSAAVTAAQQANAQAKQDAERQRRGLPTSPAPAPAAQSKPASLPGGFSGGPQFANTQPKPAIAPATPAVTQAAPQATATPAASPSRPMIPKIGPTPAGQELVGIKAGVPQYAPIGEVYGQSAGANIPMRAPATDQQVRDNFQRSSTAQAVRAQAASPSKRMGLTIPRGPASQPAATGSALDDPRNAFSKAAYQRTAAAEAQGIARQKQLSQAKNIDDPKKFFTGRVLPLNQLVKARG